MEQISGLMDMLSEIVDWNKARLACFSMMVVALLKVQTTNLRQIAVASGGTKASADSRYRRINRFFALFPIDICQITRWLLTLLIPTDQPLYLIMDRTNWCYGKQAINVFMLSVAYEGIAIPVFWKVSDKKGTSSAKEQIALLETFFANFKHLTIASVLADREFGNKALFRWLIQRRILFHIRIKSHFKVTRSKKRWANSAKDCFSHLMPKECAAYDYCVELFGESVYLAASRSERGELMIVATNTDVKNAIPAYLRRWEIENLFQSLKGRGFQFESTHMTRPDRVEKLILVLAVALCFAHKAGEWQARKRPIRLNKHRQGGMRPQYSFFRYGLDWIRDSLFNLDQQFAHFTRYLKHFFTSAASPAGALL